MKIQILSAIAAISAFSAQGQSWNFSSDAQGWQVVDRGGSRASGYVTGSDTLFTPDWNAAGGLSGGYISHVDPSSLTFFFMSPQNLGDYSAFAGGALNFALNCDSLVNWGNDNFIILRSGGTALFAEIGLPSQNNWISYSVNLTPASFRDLGFNNITAGQLNSVLANLTSLEISAEYTASPPWEITSLDSVSFQAVPEPAAVSFLILAAVSTRLLPRRKN